MDSQEKFLFQTSFDTDALARAAEAQAAAEQEVEEPPAPTFSEEELAAAKEAAFAAGRAEGITETEHGIARRTEEQLAALTARFESLSEAFATQLADQHQDTLLAAMTVVRKLFPKLNREGRLDEAQAVVEDCLERLRDEPRIVVRATDQELDSLKAHVDACIKRSGFSGKVVFLADDRLSTGDVRVEWADGGAERDQTALWQEIDAIIDRMLSPKTQKTTADTAGKAAPEKPQSAEQKAPAAPKKAAPTKVTAKKAPAKPASPADIEPLRRAKTA